VNTVLRTENPIRPIQVSKGKPNPTCTCCLHLGSSANNSDLHHQSVSNKNCIVDCRENLYSCKLLCESMGVAHKKYSQRMPFIEIFTSYAGLEWNSEF
jgi:hypothetical protein